MKIAITEVADAKEGLIALGLRTLLLNAGIDIAPSPALYFGPLEKSPAAAPAIAAPAALPAPSAPAPARRKYKASAAVKPAPVKRAAKETSKAAAAPTSDTRGTRRDAIRAALAKGPAPIEIMAARAQATFPEMNRTDVGTVLCQLSKAGECELGEDRLWRSSK